MARLDLISFCFWLLHKPGEFWFCTQTTHAIILVILWKFRTLLLKSKLILNWEYFSDYWCHCIEEIWRTASSVLCCNHVVPINCYHTFSCTISSCTYFYKNYIGSWGRVRYVLKRYCEGMPGSQENMVIFL